MVNVGEWLLLYDKSVYFQLYHGENRVIFWGDIDYICVVVDQRAQLDIYSSWSLIQESHVEYFYIL
jgi:hypothetical protein